MKALIIALLLVVLPVAAFAAPLMGVYFTYHPGQMHYSPTVPFDQFEGYVFVHNVGCYLTAVEFMVTLPSGIAAAGYTLPNGTLSLGSPFSGIAISFWPPMDGFNPGYNLVCTLKLLAVDQCMFSEGGGGGGGALMDAPVRIVASPETGLIGGTCYPDYEIFEFFGLTSTICPHFIAVEQESWGAIKSMYR